MKEQFDIVLKHIWSNERRTVPVELVRSTFVSVRWGQCGIYDLNLLENKLTARSQKAQRKGKPLWQAEDIEAVRFMVKRYLSDDAKSETLAAMKRHADTMPVAFDLDELETE